MISAHLCKICTDFSARVNDLLVRDADASRLETFCNSYLFYQLSSVLKVRRSISKKKNVGLFCVALLICSPTLSLLFLQSKDMLPCTGDE